MKTAKIIKWFILPEIRYRMTILDGTRGGNECVKELVRETQKLPLIIISKMPENNKEYKMTKHYTQSHCSQRAPMVFFSTLSDTL